MQIAEGNLSRPPTDQVCYCVGRRLPGHFILNFSDFEVNLKTSDISGVPGVGCPSLGVSNMVVDVWAPGHVVYSHEMVSTHILSPCVVKVVAAALHAAFASYLFTQFLHFFVSFSAQAHPIIASGEISILDVLFESLE